MVSGRVEELTQLADGPTDVVKWRGVVIYFLELQRGKVTSTYEGGEKDYTKQNAAAGLVTRS
jgi:hypothetical protein